MMNWVELNEVVELSDPNNIITNPVVIRVSSINTLKKQSLGKYPATLVSLQNDQIFVSETIEQIFDLCSGLHAL
jgi:hypothetical protein